MKNMFTSLFETQDQLSKRDSQRGSRLLVTDGVCAMGMGALAGGPFLAAFALAIGASNYEIGMLATIALLSQLMQLPGLVLTNYFPKRRAIVTALAGTSRLLWLLIILIPLLFVNRGITFLLQWFLISALVGAAAGPAWNSLLRDIVPRERFGRVFAQRMTMGTVLALGLTLGGGWFVDRWKAVSPDTALYAYSCLFALGLVLGLIATFAVSRLPEPTMKQHPDTSLLDLVLDPVKDGNYRRLLAFLAFWSFAVNMAGPFFVIYMLQRIGISLFLVTMLTVTSQVAHLLFLKIWGKLADLYSCKSVLAASGPLFFISVLAWCFTTMPESYFLTIPILFVIHALSGIGLAGVNISAAGIALKLSPNEKAHGYMTVFGLVGALAGACGPLVAGLLADFFGARELSLPLNWSDPARELSVYALNFRALDFVFLIAFVVGMFALRKLTAVKEEGEVPQEKVLGELLDQVFLPFKTVSSVEGLRNRVAQPVASILRVAKKRKARSAKEDERANVGM
ncbi:MAG: MFS transporter [Kiritimatiellae bacterium]|nr:MFS transporter [Kiritimatiellia bacterium]